MGSVWFTARGTSGDFVLLPDPDGTAHPDLSADFVRAICSTESGLDAVGLLRVVRSVAVGHNSPAEWFMDDRLADGTVRDMCGNGVRVFARHLYEAGLVEGPEFSVQTRDGLKFVEVGPELVTVDMGPWTASGQTVVSSGSRQWRAVEVNLGDPHAVVFVDDVDEVGELDEPLAGDPLTHPDGINVEFVQVVAPDQLRVLVHNRSTGRVASCDTGSCAAGIALASRSEGFWSRPVTVRTDGGAVDVRVERDRAFLAGPATVLSSGVWEGSR